MTEHSKQPRDLTQTVVNITIRLGFLLLLLAWCLMILLPFANPLIWGVIIGISASGVYKKIKGWVGGRSGLASVLYVMIFLVIMGIPSYFFIDSMIEGASTIGDQMSSGEFRVPPANPDVKDWPVIGGPLYNAWHLAATNLTEALSTYSAQLESLGLAMLNSVVNIGTGILMFAFSVIISAVLLAYGKEGEEFSKALFKKIVGKRGEEFAKVAEVTIKNVTKGVLGVALIQSLLVGVGLMLSGVPYAGLWTLIVLILAIIQLPASLVTIPAIIYLFTVSSPVSATLWTIYLFAAGASDNVLKPVLLGKGAPVPMLVIFLGSIGGFIVSGFVGLFVGAIVLSLGYKLLETWIKTPDVSA